MSRVATGLWAGTAAGLAMAAVLAAWMAAAGPSPWAYPNLIASTWLGDGVALGGLGFPALLGYAAHQAMSALLGLATVPLIRDLRPLRKRVTAVVVALASYPLVAGLVLSWASPRLEAGLPPAGMALALVVFGAVMGEGYLRLRPR